MKKTIVVFANSIKHKGHCIAGKDINTKEWVRAVSNKEGAELSNEQSKYTNPYGSFRVKTLQKVEMDFLEKVSLINQPENYVISNETWQQRYNIDASELSIFLDAPETLWGDGNRIDFQDIENEVIVIEQSLYLVQVSNLCLSRENTEWEGKIKTKRYASFTYRDNSYKLSVTDSNFDDIIDNSSALKNILCISLAENFNGYCYKIVATIF
jgi:hypothetical protein